MFKGVWDIRTILVTLYQDTDAGIGFNSTIDFFLTILSAVQLWRFTISATDRGPVPRLHLCARIRKMPKQARIRRVWQTVSLSGPLLLSGIASIVKTYVSSILS